MKIKSIFSSIFICALVSCSAKKDVSETLRFRLHTEPPTLDWTIATDNVSKEVIVNLQEGLLKQDAQGKTIPSLAEKWEVLDNGTRYLFTLRPNLKWSDGQALTAQHFVDSWERLLSPSVASEYAYFLFDLVNAEAFQSGKIQDFSQVGVKALSDLQLEVKLRSPVAYWINIPTFWVTFPIRKDLIAKHGDQWTQAKNFVGTGAYTLKEHKRDAKIVLEKNPFYWESSNEQIRYVEFKIVKDDSVAVSLFNTGDLDIVRNLPPTQLKALAQKAEFKKHPYFRGTYLGLNIQEESVKNPLVRKALALAIDRNEIAQVLTPFASGAKSWVPEGLLGYSFDVGLGFNPEEAKKIWAQIKNPPQSLDLWFDQNETYKLMVENIQNQWKKHLGVETKIQSQEWKVHLKQLDTRAPAIWRLGWGADYPDPDTFMNLFTCNSGNNHTGFCNAQFDKLIREAAASSQESFRNEAYIKAQKILLEDEVAIIPIFTESSLHLVSQRVSGFKVNPMGDFLLRDFRLK